MKCFAFPLKLAQQGLQYSQPAIGFLQRLAKASVVLLYVFDTSDFVDGLEGSSYCFFRIYVYMCAFVHDTRQVADGVCSRLIRSTPQLLFLSLSLFWFVVIVCIYPLRPSRQSVPKALIASHPAGWLAGWLLPPSDPHREDLLRRSPIRNSRQHSHAHINALSLSS